MEVRLRVHQEGGGEGLDRLTWPVEYGGLGRTQTERLILAEELTARDAPLVNVIGWGLAAGALPGRWD